MLEEWKAAAHTKQEAMQCQSAWLINNLYSHLSSGGILNFTDLLNILPN